jgi:uncharacterized protein (TIGR03067 family)
MTARAAVRFLLAAYLTAFGAARAEDDPEPPDKGLRELKGTWTVTKVLFRGRELKSPDEAATWVFDGRKLTQTFPPNKRKGKEATETTYKVKLDTSKKPYKLTATPEAGGKERKWIFKIEKGELRVVSTREADFPKDFDDPDATVGMVMARRSDKPVKDKAKE